MINLHELRVGDIVLAEFEGQSREGEVVGIDREERKVDVKTTVQDFWYDPEHLNAIPLDVGASRHYYCIGRGTGCTAGGGECQRHPGTVIREGDCLDQ